MSARLSQILTEPAFILPVLFFLLLCIAVHMLLTGGGFPIRLPRMRKAAERKCIHVPPQSAYVAEPLGKRKKPSDGNGGERSPRHRHLGRSRTRAPARKWFTRRPAATAAQAKQLHNFTPLFIEHMSEFVGRWNGRLPFYWKSEVSYRKQKIRIVVWGTAGNSFPNLASHRHNVEQIESSILQQEFASEFERSRPPKEVHFWKGWSKGNWGWQTAVRFEYAMRNNEGE